MSLASHPLRMESILAAVMPRRLPSFGRFRRPLGLVAAATSLAAGLGAAALTTLAPDMAPVRAQGTPGLLEFRWDNSGDYRKLYYFMTDSGRLKRSEYYLVLRPRDRKTAILKLSVTIPDYFDGTIDPKYIKLCKMSEGGMLSRTQCNEQIPATITMAPDGRAIEVFPDTPVSDKGTIGLYMIVFNPFNVGMFQFNALAQAPGDVPVAGYLGSWLIEISPSGN